MSQLWITDDVRPDLAPFLRAIILAEIDDQNRPSRNVGGWKSDNDFFNWPFAVIRKIRDELTTRLKTVPTGWAMVNRLGSFHERHDHDPTFMCGIYYVASGDPAVPTIFEEMLNGVRVEHRIAPKPGRLVIFPGWMPHSVPVYDGAKPRISVAFDTRP